MGENRLSSRRRRLGRVASSLVLLLAFVAIGPPVSAGQASSDPPDTSGTILARDLTLSGADFTAGQSKGPVSKDRGLVLTSPATAVYTSSVLLAPIPFSDLGSIWEADLPPGSSLLLEVRTSPDEQGDRWGAWEVIEEEDDLPPMPFGERAGELLFVPQSDGVHQRIQYRLYLSAVRADAFPTLHRLTFTFIDARTGPSTQAILEGKGSKEIISTVDKPAVISREEWGCPEGEESPRWEPEYARVTHVIVHHTATPNNDVDWAARVRSIWYYHANTRGWGDIGYNYLVDPLGNVYEGRAGGDNVVGGHAYDYNRGTMGVGSLGTYSTAAVPAPLQESLEALIAWKSSLQGIDPFGASFNSHKVYAHISGHRDVGQTSCPGDVLYNLLPNIRQNVQVRLLQQEDAISVDDNDPEFETSQTYWHDGCGLEGHSLWTHSTTDPGLSANWAIWRPDLPLRGWYEVFAYVPSCAEAGLPEYTEGARYRVYYRGGGTTVVVNQKEERGRWVSLGTYDFYPGTTGYVYLGDMADDHWRALWYDTVKWVLRAESLEPPSPPLLGSPPQLGWSSSRQVTLSWTIPPTVTVNALSLVVAEDPLFDEVLVQTNLGVVEEYYLNVSADYPALYWSVRSHSGNGYGAYAPTRQFGVDTEPPSSSIVGLYRSSTGIHVLMWQGEDTGSGVASYTVQVRSGTTGPWQDLWTDIPWNSGVVQVPAEGTHYYRVQARDGLGYTEAPHEGDGDLSSDDVTPLNWSCYHPLVLRGHTATPGPTRLPTTPVSTATPGSSPTPSPTPAGQATQPSASPTPAVTASPTETPLPTPTVPSPTPTRLPTPPGGLSGLPDLRVEALRSSQDSPFDCARPTGIAVEVSNVGTGAAGPFYLALQGEGLEDCRWRFEELLPGQRAERICPTIVLNAVVTATVDVEDQVVEADEENNSLAIPINVLALPTCTPAPVRSP